MPTSALTWVTWRTSSRFTSNCSAKLRSIKNRGIQISFCSRVCPPPVDDYIGSGPVDRGAHYSGVHGACLTLSGPMAIVFAPAHVYNRPQVHATEGVP